MFTTPNAIEFCCSKAKKNLTPIKLIAIEACKSHIKCGEIKTVSFSPYKNFNDIAGYKNGLLAV